MSARTAWARCTAARAGSAWPRCRWMRAVSTWRVASSPPGSGSTPTLARRPSGLAHAGQHGLGFAGELLGQAVLGRQFVQQAGEVPVTEDAVPVPGAQGLAHVVEQRLQLVGDFPRGRLGFFLIERLLHLLA